MSFMRDQPDNSRAIEPLWHLLYRFLWPFQYFRDVTRGDWLVRQQNYRYNRAMRVYLPGFMLKWALLTAIWFCLGGTLSELGIPLGAAGFFLTGSLTLVVVVMLAVDWLWLERFPNVC